MEATPIDGTPNLAIEGFDQDAVLYNLWLAIDAELVRGFVLKVQIDGSYSLTQQEAWREPWRLTWSGHDLLDSAHDPALWNTAREVAKSKGLDLLELPLDVVQVLLINALKRHLGL